MKTKKKVKILEDRLALAEQELCSQIGSLTEMLRAEKKALDRAFERIRELEAKQTAEGEKQADTSENAEE